MATRTWLGAGTSGNWTTRANWGGVVPGPGDIAVIPDGEVVVSSPVASVQAVRVEPDFSDQYPVLTLFSGGVLTVAGELSNDLYVNVYGGQLTAGSLNNRNELNIGDETVPTASARVDVTTVTRGGFVNLHGGTSGQATFDVHGAVPTDGSYTLHGNALLEVSGKITTLSSSITLDGIAARVAVAGDLTSNSALTDLSRITGGFAGGLLLSGGASVRVSGDLLNQSSVSLRPFGASGTLASTLTVPGLLTNDLFLMAAYGAWSIKAGALTNNGQMFLGGTSSPAPLSVTGALTNNSLLEVSGVLKIAAGSFGQSGGGSLAIRSPGANTPTIAASGSARLAGTLIVSTAGAAAGQSLTLMTFAPGHLTGLFDRISFEFGSFGSGTVVTSLDGKVKGGLIYDDAGGAVRFVTVAAPSTTLDTFKGASGLWTSAANWSAGAPTFFSDVVIGTAAVTLSADATVNSVSLRAGARLSSAAGTDLSVGATLAVAAGATMTVGGQATIDSAVTNDGTVVVGANGLAEIRGNAGGSGTFTIGAGGTLVFRALDTAAVAFAGSRATLELDRPSDFKGVLAGLVTGDAIDLVGVKVAGVADDGRTLTVRKADTATMTFTLKDKQAGTAFAVQDDGAGGSRLVLGPAPRFSGALAAADPASPPQAFASSELAPAALSGHGLFLDRPATVLT